MSRLVVESKRSVAVRSWFATALAAAGWAVGGAAALGGAWAGGLWLVELLAGSSLPEPTAQDWLRSYTSLTLGASGAGVGLFVGFVFGLVRGRGDWLSATVLWAVWVAAVGMIGGALTLTAISATSGVLRPEIGSAFTWAAAGFLAGLVGYFCRERPAARKEDDNWLGDVVPEEPSPETPVASKPVARPLSRLLPIVAVSGCCLVLVVVTPPSSLGVPMLAVGLLGLATAWALAGQERRLRELERQLARRNRGAAETAALGGGESCEVTGQLPPG